MPQPTTLQLLQEVKDLVGDATLTYGEDGWSGLGAIINIGSSWMVTYHRGNEPNYWRAFYFFKGGHIACPGPTLQSCFYDLSKIVGFHP